MKKFIVWIAMASLTGVLEAQEGKEPSTPGRNHELLKQFEGRWDTVSRNIQNGKTVESKGSEVDRIAYGGYWVVMEHTGEVHGKPFKGQGTLGYDPVKKKYLLTWIDNISPFAMWAEGETDVLEKTFTFESEGFCPELGKIAKTRTVFAFKDADHRTLTFYRPGKSGAEEKMGEILYTRQS